MSTGAPALELRGIEKRFGPVHALRGADFTLRSGEVHALLGENGAGKTTLMRVAAGLVRADAGVMLVDGRVAKPRTPRDARRLGIGMVHQHFTSIPALTVAENLALAAGWPVGRRELLARVRELMERAGLPLEPDMTADALGVALKQRLEILKALAANTRILLLDEPTAALTPPEANDLLSVVRDFAARGGSAVLITHRLAEALSAADRVTVLRAGRVRLSGTAAGETAGSLAAAMIGADAAAISGGDAVIAADARPGAREASARERATSAVRAPLLVKADHLDVAHDWPATAGARAGASRLAVRKASFELRAGEVVGVAAVEGSGQRELLRAIVGLLPIGGGKLEVASPVAFVPEDRTTEGLIPELSLTENFALGLGDSAPWVCGAQLDWRAARRRTAEVLREFEIRAPGPDAPASALSGGNQQRLVIARALELAPKVLAAENPSRGLDVRATHAVWQRLRAAAAAGAAVLVYASDLDEVLSQADRVLVMAGGVLRAAPPQARRDEVGALMLAGGGLLRADPGR
ncbi:MAG TPA: ATP-binding cassette domain-containing protein [Gemmatimonadales bacterium]|nr:ATP-binding cassette domain-containing protein [Gemmatimonadales bacterium]